MKKSAEFILLIFLLLLSAFLALCCGSTSEAAGELAGLLRGGCLSEQAKTVLLDIRLPRILGAAAAGILLAAAGCAVQLIFRNPLSSPHVLGSVNASALGAVAVMALGGVSLTAMLAGGVIDGNAGREFGWQSAGAGVFACAYFCPPYGNTAFGWNRA